MVETYPNLPDPVVVDGFVFKKHPKFRILTSLHLLQEKFHMEFMRNPKLSKPMFGMRPELYMWMYGNRYTKRGREIFEIKDFSHFCIVDYGPSMSFDELQEMAKDTRSKQVEDMELLGIIHNHPSRGGDLLQTLRPSMADLWLLEEVRKERRDDFNGIFITTEVNLLPDMYRLMKARTIGWCWERGWTDDDAAAVLKGKKFLDFPEESYWVPILYSEEV